MKGEANFDVVIVGASFAGLVAARTAAMRGLSVAVVERKADPGAQPHTTGILVKEAVDALDIPAELTHRVRGVRLYSPAMCHIDLDASGYYFLATDTPGLLRWLAVQARLAGAYLYFGHRFSSAVHEGGRIRLATPRVTARFLLGADGARSRVARNFGLGRNRRFLIGAELELTDAALSVADRLHCFVDRRLAPGYIGWAVPGVGMTQLGLARTPDGAPDPEALMAKLRSAGIIHARAEVLARRAGLIPVGGLCAPFATDRVLLIGDAAGLVSPLTGGGIFNAFHFGRRAAQVVSDYLQDRGPEPSRVLAPELPKYRWKGLLRRLVDTAQPDLVTEAALRTAPFRRLAREIYFRERGGPQLSPQEHRYFKPTKPRTKRTRIIAC